VKVNEGLDYTEIVYQINVGRNTYFKKRLRIANVQQKKQSFCQPKGKEKVGIEFENFWCQ